MTPILCLTMSICQECLTDNQIILSFLCRLFRSLRAVYGRMGLIVLTAVLLFYSHRGSGCLRQIHPAYASADVLAIFSCWYYGARDVKIKAKNGKSWNPPLAWSHNSTPKQAWGLSVKEKGLTLLAYFLLHTY